MVLVRDIAIEFMLGVSRDLYPREFAGLLRAEDDVIIEVLILPATIWGEGFASIATAHMPMDRSVVGSVHSHPSPNYSPSKQDLIHFGKTGSTHFIIKYPYESPADIACYDNSGERQELEVIHYEE